MKAAEMRQLSAEELGARVTEWEEARFRAKCSQTIGQLQNTNTLRELRHDIARAKTIINEKSQHAGSPE